ncbi:MAG: NAD(P)H-binding protein [Planctomycetota bacterium]|nr:NAD(P)H-binding protein [Planctomycetota bacterium]
MSTITTVAMTGATGFVGGYVVRELLARGYGVRALVRDRAAARSSLPGSVTLVEGDILDERRVDELLGGAQACVNLAGIIREVRTGGRAQTFERVHTRAARLLVERCTALGVRRFVQMSALGVRDVGVSEYQRTKWEAEQAVRLSELDWTIFRPSLIHGPEGEFVRLAKGLCSGHEAPWVFIPYFAREVEDVRVPLGPVTLVAPRVQPVWVQDVAGAMVRSLGTPAAVGEIYNLAGGEVLTWPEMLREVRDHVHGANRDLEPMGVPSVAAAWGAKAAGAVGLGGLLPFDEGMARMGAEDSTASVVKATEDLEFRASGFRATFRAYAGAV